MKKKLDLAFDVINEFMQWFMDHNFTVNDAIREKMDAFFDCEVNND